MEDVSLILGMGIGVVIGVILAILAILALCCIRIQKQRAKIDKSSSRRSAKNPPRSNGLDKGTVMSDSTESSRSFDQNQNSMSLWFDVSNRGIVDAAASGIPQYCYRDLQKATKNFTTLIGQGSFGPVYKAQMSSGKTVAVKVLATDSKQGERDFQMEVKLFARLHHRNLMNLVGYCTEKGKNMLIYAYMSNGSLASQLYDLDKKVLSWNMRVHIALDVARGLEYLHDGAVPPVIHRDIKSSNILLDQFMKARVADFGLSREEIVDGHACNLRGTFGYLDPEYISTRTFTKKSDVYSYGVLLFELIAGRNPQQGLLEYVEMAAMNTEGGTGWEEIADNGLEAEFDVQELNEVAAIAYKCINRDRRMRPSMRDIVQVLSCYCKSSHDKKHHRRTLPAEPEEVTIDVEDRYLHHRKTLPEEPEEVAIDVEDSDVKTPVSKRQGKECG